MPPQGRRRAASQPAACRSRASSAPLPQPFLGADWPHLSPPPAATVTGGWLFRADAQAEWLTTLQEVQGAATGGAALAVSAELSRIAGAVAAAAAAAPASAHLRGLWLATAAFIVVVA